VLFSLPLSQVTLVLVMTSVAILLFASETFVSPMKEPSKMSMWLAKQNKKLPGRKQRRRQLGKPRGLLADISQV
jgi:hypothetical protein